MCRAKLLEVLKMYESECREAPLSKNANDKETAQTLLNDITRTDFDFLGSGAQGPKVRLYKNILYSALAEFPLRYVQGMAEVATVLVNIYFQDVAGSFSGAARATVAADNILYEGEELSAYQAFVDKNAELLQRLRTALVNIYRKKFLVFFNDNFKMYKECNNVFIAVMKKKGIAINKDVSFKYMNHILTFLKRAVDSEKTAYEIYRVILTSDPSVLFVLLIIFYRNIQSNEKSSAVESTKKIAGIGNDFARQVAEQQLVFARTREELRGHGCAKKYALFGVAAGILALGIAAAFKMDRKD